MRTKAAKLSAPNVWLDWKALIVARKHGDNILESTGGQQQRHLDQLWIKIIALDQKFNRSHVVLKAWSTQCRFFPPPKSSKFLLFYPDEFIFTTNQTNWGSESQNGLFRTREKLL